MSIHALTSASSSSNFNILDDLCIKPANGCLVPLRTRAEVQASNDTIEVYVCAVPLREASKVLRAIKDIPGQNEVDLHHLRRAVKDEYIPESLRRAIAATRAKQENQDFKSNIAEAHSHTEDAVVELNVPMIYVLLCATCMISQKDLLALLTFHITEVGAPTTKTLSATAQTASETQTSNPSLDGACVASQLSQALRLFTLNAPLHAPPSPSHAIQQSLTLWPTLYNPNNGYGPSPSIIARTQREMEADGAAGHYIALARKAGRQSGRKGSGIDVGVVVVERDKDVKKGKVVVVAGDGRWTRQSQSVSCCASNGNGDPAGHAVMRAISLVAMKRRELALTDSTVSISVSDTSVFPTPIQGSAVHLSAPDSTGTSNSASGGNLPSIASPSTKEESSTTFSKAGISCPTYPQDHFLSPLEREVFSIPPPHTLRSGGYLCLDLEFYITAEPCIMCCMALVHSRVGRVVFVSQDTSTRNGTKTKPGGDTSRSRARRTGGAFAESRIDFNSDSALNSYLASEASIPPTTRPTGSELAGYGLFWRSDLNWRFLCWEWRNERDESKTGGEGVTDVGDSSRHSVLGDDDEYEDLYDTREPDEDIHI